MTRAIFFILTIAITLAACQSQAPAEEIPPKELHLAICGTLEMPGLSVDECTETYTIKSRSVFVITDGEGNKTLLPGPLVIEALGDGE